MTDPVPQTAPRSRGFLQALWRAVPYLLVAVAAYLMWAPRRSGPDEGSMAAAFDLPVILGAEERLRLDDLRGQPILIEVFASWCSICRASAGTFRDAAQASREAPVKFVAVSVDETPGAGSAAARDWGLSCEVAHDDGRFARDYGISVLPTMILIDAEGNIANVASGAVSRSTLERWLTAVGAKRL